jgi:hypothetical protein
VREHCQELVLASVRRPQLRRDLAPHLDLDLKAAVQARVLERDRGTLGEFEHDLVVACRGPQGERADGTARRDQGHEQRARCGAGRRAAAPASVLRHDSASSCPSSDAARWTMRARRAAGPAVEHVRRIARFVAERDRRAQTEFRHQQLQKLARGGVGIERCAEPLARLRQEVRALRVRFGGRTRRLGGSERDPLVGMAAQPSLGQVQVDEHPDFRAQHLGDDRRQDVVDRAERIAADRLHLVGVGGDEDDRRVRRALVLADQRRRLEAIDVGHVDVEQDRRELGLQDVPESLRAGASTDEVVRRMLEHRLEDQQLLVEVVDDEDARAAFVGSSALVRVDRQRHSQPLRTASRCIGSTGFER